jgi:hypothetical protein
MRWIALLLALAVAGTASAGWRKREVGPVLRNHGAERSAIPGCTREAADAGRELPFGCANALNLEAMLAEPRDLVAPAPLPPPVGEHATGAREALRAGKAAPLPEVSPRAEPDQ